MKRTADIKVPLALLEKQLQEMLQNDNAKLIAKIIISNLAGTEVGLSQLLMAFMGMKEEAKWLIGDELLLDPKHLRSWEIDKDDMVEKKMSMHKNKFKVTIKAIDMTKLNNMRVVFPGIYNGTTREIDVSVSQDKLEFDIDLNISPQDVGDDI